MSEPPLPCCAGCGLLLKPPSTAHVVMQCSTCGREAYRPPGPEGVEVEAGETFVMPEGAVFISLDKGQSTGRFTRDGINWLFRMLLFEPEPTNDDELRTAVQRTHDQADAFIEASPLLADFDLTDEKTADQWMDVVKQNQSGPEWLALLLVIMANAWLGEDWIGDRSVLLWKLATIRSMFLFQTNLHDMVWRGYTTIGVDQLRAAQEAWRNRSGTENEEYWQQLLDRNPFLINLLTTGPVVVEQQKAYVGGKSIDNRGGNLVDFLLKNGVGGNAGLLEIKTPETQLLAAAEYRNGIFSASPALSGAVVQVVAYRDTLLKEYHAVAGGTDFTAFNPLCIVLVGTHETELGTAAKRRSFELLRASLSGVVVITYDELFARVSSLLSTIEGN